MLERQVLGYDQVAKTLNEKLLLLMVIMLLSHVDEFHHIRAAMLCSSSPTAFA